MWDEGGLVIEHGFVFVCVFSNLGFEYVLGYELEM